MILWEKSDCSPDWTELLSILADLAKLTEKCSKNCGLLPKHLKSKNLEKIKRYCDTDVTLQFKTLYQNLQTCLLKVGNKNHA